MIIPREISRHIITPLADICIGFSACYSYQEDQGLTDDHCCGPQDDYQEDAGSNTVLVQKASVLQKHGLLRRNTGLRI